MSARPATRPPKGLRRLERWIVGIAMAIVAFVLEKVVLHAVRDTPEAPATESASTLTATGGEVNLDDLR